MALRFPLVLAFVGLLPLAAAATDFPKRKSGLWEIKTSIASMPGRTMAMQQCIDQGTDDAMRGMGERMGKQACTKNEFKRDGSRFLIESVCKLGASTATTRGVFTGDFGTGYKAELKSTYDPPMMGRKEESTTIEARWVGPCKAGMKPGDMVTPDGKVIPGTMFKK